MRIRKLMTPWFATSDSFAVYNVVQRGSVVQVDTDEFPLESLLIEFESATRARSFVSAIETDEAAIIIDEDSSLAAAPHELREKYERCRATGNTEQLEGLLTELWEDYGVDPTRTAPRETSGIHRLAIMHDDGVMAAGFSEFAEAVQTWMKENGFPTGHQPDVFRF